MSDNRAKVWITEQEAPTLAPSGQAEVPNCCAATIRQHVTHNPMMVCAQCKQIIKCFKEERAYQNYLTFCRSRRRAVLVGFVEEHFTIVFKSYDRPFAR